MDRPDRQDDTIRLLSLDGGGPGSLSQLRIIGEYMSRLAFEKRVDVDTLFPAELFDVIGGVGFGVYVALLLGPLRMPVSQATEELITLGTTLFPPDQKETLSVARDLSSQLFNVDAYLRLNVDHGIENLRMTSRDNLGTIETHTDVYLRGTAVSSAVDSSLQSLQTRIGLIPLGQLARSTQVQTQAKKAPAVSPYFVVRREYWEVMKRHLITSPKAKRKIMVLSGMGGCGKTQMVAYFVEKYHSRYQHIFFVDASSLSSIQSDLQSAIWASGVGYEQKTYKDAIAFLTNCPHDTNWLFILDNADNPELDLIRYLPECHHGTIFITTRNLRLGRLNNTAHLQLGPMGEIEAYEALVRAAHRTLPLSPEEENSARGLMQELGNLAVALVQAGSYCYNLASTSGNDGTAFSQYLSLFKQHRKELMTKGDKDSLDRYSRGAYTTLDLSYSLLSSLAQEFLHICGFFHYADISLAMLECAVQNDFCDQSQYIDRPTTHDIMVERMRKHLRPSGRWDDIHIHEIIHSLQSFSLVSTTSISGTVFLRFHPLVHMWSRDSLTVGEAEQFRGMAMQVIASCVSRSNVSLYRFLLPHIIALIGLGSSVQMHVNDMMRFGQVFRELGMYPRAASLFKSSLVTMEEKVGKSHLGTIEVSSYLAQAYWRQGGWNEAEKMQVEVLEQYQRLLSKDHPVIITAAASLAMTYYGQRKWNKAEKMFMEVLEQRQRLLSKEHAETIRAAANLAATYYARGKWREAEKMEVEVLEQRRRLLSKDHPDTIKAAVNLAKTYHVQGKWKEAERMEVEVLEQRQRLLSRDHPDTIDAAANLATTYFTQGRWKEAKELQTEAINSSTKVLGTEHPQTIQYMKDMMWMRMVAMTGMMVLMRLARLSGIMTILIRVSMMGWWIVMKIWL